MTTDSTDDAIEFDDYSDTTSTFGDRLVLAREAMGLGQGQLARRMGVKLQTLRNWEEDRAEPRANRLQMLAGMLNVSMGWLMSGRGTAPSDGPPVHDSGVAPLLDDLRALRHEQLRLVERMARIEKRIVAAVSPVVPDKADAENS
jgi:HTH-type transcriptional regulator, cell division transcriptional repressor